MTFRLETTDCNILECLAEHRVLTVSQVAAVFHKSRQVIRRRLRDLEEGGLVEVVGSELGRGRGRPESSLGLTERGKTCPFFLEVDCRTETIASLKRDMTDIRQKIVNYQWYFQSGGYKRYEEVFGASLRGFRQLFLTSTNGRLVALCKLTQGMQPSNFVWLTECGRLFAEGASAEIWAKGGDLRAAQQSILGSLCCRAPLP